MTFSKRPLGPPNFPSLVMNMRMRASITLDLKKAEELNTLAASLEEATKGMFDRDGVRRLVGAWARARRVWCDLTGEDLV